MATRFSPANPTTRVKVDPDDRAESHQRPAPAMFKGRRVVIDLLSDSEEEPSNPKKRKDAPDQSPNAPPSPKRSRPAKLRFDHPSPTTDTVSQDSQEDNDPGFRLGATALRQAQQDNDDLRRQLADLQMSMEEKDLVAREELKEHQSQLETSQANLKGVLETQARLNSELLDAHSNLSNTRLQLARMGRLLEQVTNRRDELEKVFGDTQGDKSAMKEELQQATEAKDALDKEVKTIKSELSNVKAIAEAHKVEHDKSKQSLQTLETSRDFYKSQNEVYQEDQVQARQEIVGLKNSLESAKADSKRYDADLKKAKTSMVSKKVYDMEKRKVEKAEAQATLSRKDFERAKQQLGKLQQDLSDVRAEANKYRESLVQTSSVKEELEKARAESRKFTNEIKSLKKSASDSAAAAVAAEEQLSKSLRDIEQERSAALTVVNQKAALEIERNELLVKVRALEVQITSLREEMKALNGLSDQTTEVQRLEREAAEATAKVSQLQKVDRELQDANRTIRELRNHTDTCAIANKPPEFWEQLRGTIKESTTRDLKLLEESRARGWSTL